MVFEALASCWLPSGGLSSSGSSACLSCLCSLPTSGAPPCPLSVPLPAYLLSQQPHPFPWIPIWPTASDTQSPPKPGVQPPAPVSHRHLQLNVARRDALCLNLSSSPISAGTSRESLGLQASLGFLSFSLSEAVHSRACGAHPLGSKPCPNTSPSDFCSDVVSNFLHCRLPPARSSLHTAGERLRPSGSCQLPVSEVGLESSPWAASPLSLRQVLPPTPNASGISLATPSSEPLPDPTAYASAAVHGLIPSESRALHSALSPRRWTLGASVTRWPVGCPQGRAVGWADGASGHGHSRSAELHIGCCRGGGRGESLWGIPALGELEQLVRRDSGLTCSLAPGLVPVTAGASWLSYGL